MFCPIRFRWDCSGLIYTKYIQSKSARRQICQRLIVSSANIFALVCGILILMTVDWCQKRYTPIVNSLGNAYNTGVCIIVIASYGCVTQFIKSNFRQSLSYFTNSFNRSNLNNSRVVQSTIVQAPGNRPHSFYHSFIHFWDQKWQQLKRWFKYSPILTVNLFLIIIIIPAELSVITNCVNYIIGSYLKLSHISNQTMSEPTVAVLFLQVSYISVLLSQFIVLINIYDVINKSNDKHSIKSLRRLRSNREMETSLDSSFARRMYKQLSLNAKIDKNKRFQQHLTNIGNMPTKTDPDIDQTERLKTITEEPSEEQLQEDWMQPSTSFAMPKLEDLSTYAIRL